jgi:nitroreductase
MRILMRTDISELTVAGEQTCECSIHPLLAQRRSWKAFSPRIIEPETFALLFEAARWAPSCMNEQPWSFIVATKQNPPEFECLLGCLHEFNGRWAQHAAALLLSVARLTFTSNAEPNRHALHDVGQAIANLTFQASACGLMVCQMAGFDVERSRQTFSVPSSHEPVAMAAIGYPGDVDSLPKKLGQKMLAPRQRKLAEKFVFEGTWGQPAVWNGERT